MTILDIVVFIVILGVMVLAHELGHFMVAKRAGVKVEEFGFGFPPRIFGIRRGETLYSLNIFPLGGFVKMLGEDDPTEQRSFAHARKRWRTAILVAGPAMNLVLAVLLFSISFMAGWPTPVSSEIVVAAVQTESPAESAGLRSGDTIVAVRGQTVTSMRNIKDATNSNPGRELSITVRRDGQSLDFTVRPREGGPSHGTIGVSLSEHPTKIERVSYPLQTALVKGTQETMEVIGLTFYVPVLALRGQVSPDLARPVGPVGIFDAVSQATEQTIARSWWFPLLSTTALLSVGLGIANLLPIPGLDGGRLLFVLIETIRGRRVNPQREGMIHLVGIAFLLSMVLVISYFDVLTPIGTIDWGP